jgi:hypothetical protein
MKLGIRILLVIGICMRVQSLSAAIISTWNFDSGTQNGTAYAGTVPYTANSFDTAHLTAASMTTVTPASASGGTQGAGTGFNGSGTALKFTAGTGSSKSVDGSSFVLSLTTSSTAQLNGTLSITYNYLSSATGVNALNTWTASGIGGTQTAAIIQDGAWHQATVVFTGLSVGAGQTITFTDALSGYANNNPPGVNFAEFDNISFTAAFTAVPEPVNYGMAAFGLIFVAGSAGRFYFRRLRIA